MFIIACFVIAIAVAQYTSNRGYVEGLSRLNSMNMAINICSQSLEGLSDSIAVLSEMESGKSISKNLHYFEVNQKQVRAPLMKTLQISEISPETKNLLREALSAINRFEGGVALLFQNHRDRKMNSAIRTEMLITRQFSSDAQEYLRKAQIDLRRKSDSMVAQLYSDRFWPSTLVIALSTIFFIFVMTIGLRVTKRIKQSVKNLGEATDRVTMGDYQYQANILNHDEFGVLTNRFNTMTTSVYQGKKELTQTIERIHALQDLAQQLAEALRTQEAVNIAIEEGIRTLKSNSGSIMTVNPDQTFIEMVGSKGMEAELCRKWKVIPLRLISPVTDCIRMNQPYFFENLDQLKMAYPDFPEEFRIMNIQASAILPLKVGQRELGAICFNFDSTRTFSQDERDFALAIARQAAQALFRTQLYEEAQYAIHARDEFLSIASHELKTPLTPMKLQLQMLSRSMDSENFEMNKPKLSKTLKDCDQHFNRLSKLIMNLLDISRISSGKLVLSPEIVNVNLLVRDLLIQLKDQLHQNRMEVEFQELNEVSAVIDAPRFEQVVTNLISNAMKYAPGKPLKLVLSSHETNFTLKVIDQGPGIERKDFGRIFQKFERISSVDNVGGLGLGLYITKQIVESHKGDIWVESEPGTGAAFVCEIPLRT
ncbi:MAG: ATP-binding protein [Bdellovibrionota bacterium]